MPSLFFCLFQCDARFARAIRLPPQAGPRAEAAGRAARQGWKVVDESRAFARLELSVEACHEQQVRAIKIPHVTWGEKFETLCV